MGMEKYYTGCAWSNPRMQILQIEETDCEGLEHPQMWGSAGLLEPIPCRSWSSAEIISVYPTSQLLASLSKGETCTQSHTQREDDAEICGTKAAVWWQRQRLELFPWAKGSPGLEEARRIFPSKALEGPAHTLNSDFWPPEPWGN